MLDWMTPALLEGDLPTPEELYTELPLSTIDSAFIARARKTIENILKGQDKRRLLIVGPCSIHDLESAREYALRLKQLSHKVSDRFFVIMRTYFEKSRTERGWKGFLYDPDINESYRIEKGVRQTRSLLLELAKMELAAGCELLEINTAHYYSDLLSWGCIGARTCTSPPHRQLAASLGFPIGFKNSVDGNIGHAIQAVLAASSEQAYLGMAPNGRPIRIKTEGNPFCHVVLRGGLLAPNYGPESVASLLQHCYQAHITTRFLIDASHGNCAKKHRNQIPAFKSIIQQMAEGNDQIGGVMLESHLNEGKQVITPSLHYGVSITDPCLDWETTEELILSAHRQLHCPVEAYTI